MMRRWPGELRGGNPCLDFTNTIGWRAAARPEERLAAFSDVLRWSLAAELLPPASAVAFEKAAAGRPVEFNDAFNAAISLRELLYRTFAALAAGARPEHEDLDRLRDLYSDAIRNSKLELDGAQATWVARANPKEPRSLLWPLVQSAVELLMSENIERVRVCQGAGCGWLFLDASRNRSRLWCDSTDCGNRARVRRYYQAHRSGAKP